GRVIGVLDSDISLKDISRFLSQDRPFESGEAMLVGADGNLIGTSLGLDVVGPQGDRVAATEANKPLLSDVARAVGSFSAITGPVTTTVHSEETAYRVDVRPFE